MLENLLVSAEPAVSGLSHFPVIIGSRWSAGSVSNSGESAACGMKIDAGSNPPPTVSEPEVQVDTGIYR